MQAAQKAMANAETPLQKLQGFVSKIEDFHRLMNFLEVCIGYILICFLIDSAVKKNCLFQVKFKNEGQNALKFMIPFLYRLFTN